MLAENGVRRSSPLSLLSPFCGKDELINDQLILSAESGMTHVVVTRRIPMALTENHIQALTGSQEAFEKLLQERLREAVRIALISVLEEEVAAFIGALPAHRTAM